MGWLSGLFSGGDTIKGALEGAGTLAKDVRTAITGEITSEKRAELQARAAEIEAELAKAQMEVNKAEAESAHWFVASWRPFLGWTFGAVIAAHYLILPIAEWTITALGLDVEPLPQFDLSAIWPAVLGMLGMAGLRTGEKIKGVQGRH
jgi:roadblock/LC7 domain-containing protein